MTNKFQTRIKVQEIKHYARRNCFNRYKVGNNSRNIQNKKYIKTR